MKFIFIKYFPNYETQKLQSSALRTFGSLFWFSRSFINMPDHIPHKIIDMILLRPNPEGFCKF